MVTDLAELLIHPRALILRHCGNAVDAGSGRALLQALAMLLLCLALGNLLLGRVLDQPLHQWVPLGVTVGLLLAAALSGRLAMSWRLVRRAPGSRRVTTLFAYLYGGAWLYLCVGAFIMVVGVQWMQPDVFDRFLVQARQGGDALPAAFAMVVQAARGPALAAGVFANVVFLAGVVWCVRAWAVFRIALDTGRLAAAAAWLLWVGMLAGLWALAWWMAT